MIHLPVSAGSVYNLLNSLCLFHELVKFIKPFNLCRSKSDLILNFYVMKIWRRLREQNGMRADEMIWSGVDFFPLKMSG